MNYAEFLKSKSQLNGGRRGIGIELKKSYYNQAVRHLGTVKPYITDDQKSLYKELDDAVPQEIPDRVHV